MNGKYLKNAIHILNILITCRDLKSNFSRKPKPLVSLINFKFELDTILLSCFSSILISLVQRHIQISARKSLTVIVKKHHHRCFTKALLNNSMQLIFQLICLQKNIQLLKQALQRHTVTNRLKHEVFLVSISPLSV